MVTRRRGGVAVEFGIVLPVLLLFVAGVLEWGRVVVAEVAVTGIARDAALTGARAESEDDPAAVARARAEGALAEARYDLHGASVTVDEVDVGGERGLQVRVSAPYTRKVPIVPTPGAVTGEVTARLEDQ
jgi:Flp pilus assembly protein TadG